MGVADLPRTAGRFQTGQVADFTEIRIIGCEPFLRYNLQAMRLMEYKRVNCKSLVSEIMPLNEVNKAFDSLYQGDNLLVMLKP